MKHCEDLVSGKEIPKSDLRHFLELKFPDENFNGQFGADIFAKSEPLRVAKTHLPLKYYKDSLEMFPETKIIQVIRNPKDTLISYYHFYRMNGTLGWFNGSWDQFFEMVKAKDLVWGDYFDTIADWYKFNVNREKSLILRYEEMKADLRGNVVKIANFIGKELTDEMIDAIVERTTFKNMAKDKKFNFEDSKNESWKMDRAKFIRKGEVGGWVQYFTEGQNEYVERRYKETLEPLGLKFDYNGLCQNN